MIKISGFGLTLAGLTLFPFAAPAQAEGLPLPPIKVNVIFRVDVRSVAQPKPSAPWWAYFPQDPHRMVPGVPAFPHWPAQVPAQPTAAPRTSDVAPNMVYDYAPSAVLPVGYDRGAPPSYWYGR
jgi:hypothetical protein